MWMECFVCRLTTSMLTTYDLLLHSQTWYLALRLCSCVCTVWFWRQQELNFDVIWGRNRGDPGSILDQGMCDFWRIKWHWDRFYRSNLTFRGTSWRRSLRLNAAGSSRLPSGRTVALGSTQPVTEMSTRDLSWGGGKSGRCVGLTTLPHSRADCLKMLGASTFCSPRGLSRPVQGELYLLCFCFFPVSVIPLIVWTLEQKRGLDSEYFQVVFLSILSSTCWFQCQQLSVYKM